MMTSLFSFIPNLGGPELLVIFVLVLVLFGAKKIPEFAKGLGKGMGEFKKARQEFENEITRAEHDTMSQPRPRQNESHGAAVNEPSPEKAEKQS